MYPNLTENMKVLMREKNGPQAVHIFDMAVYFDPSEIRIWMFLSVISDRKELKVAIQTLHYHELVVYSEGTDSFVVSDQARSQRMVDLKRTGEEEVLLKKSISFLKMAKPSYYQHFVSTNQHAKQYPRLLEDLGDLPGNMLRGMIDAKKYAVAVEYGKEWSEFLTGALDECHWTVLHLRSRLGLALLESGKSDEAISIVIDVYQKTCNAHEEEEIRYVLSIMAEVIIRSTPTNKKVSEKQLRQIVFGGKTVSDCKDNSDLKKWICYVNLISTFGLNEEGLSILEDVIKCGRSIFGSDDDSAFNVMQAKAKILTSESKFPEALDILRSIYAISEEKFDMYHKKTLEILIDMENVFIVQGKYKEALELLDEVESRIRLFFYAENEIFMIARLEMIRIHVLRRLFAKGLKLCCGVEQRLVAVYGKVHPRCFDFRKHVGEIALGLNQRHEALIFFKQILQDFENLYEVEADLRDLESRIESIESGLFNAGPGSLHWCAKNGDLRGVVDLIESGLGVDVEDSNGMRALHYASEFGRVEVARALLRNGAVYVSVCKEGCIPHQFAKKAEMLALLNTVHDFFQAVHEEDIRTVVEVASKEPCALGAKNVNGATALGLAAGLGYARVLKVLLAFDCDPNVAGSFITTPIFVSPQYGLRRTARKMDHPGTPLLIACHYGHVEVASALLKKTGKKGLQAQTDVPKDTPLHAAAKGGHMDMVRYLLAQGAVYCARDFEGQMPRQRTGNPDVKNLLRFVEGIFDDARKGKVEEVEARLREMQEGEVKAVAGARNDQRMTLVQVATKLRKFQLVKKLKKRFKRNSKK